MAAAVLVQFSAVKTSKGFVSAAGKKSPLPMKPATVPALIKPFIC